ncbi:MAG: DUF2975 domain-containing protein [Niastella sp.]|nr:DUF2975 domain-containing protein [Niastella sp.]
MPRKIKFDFANIVLIVGPMILFIVNFFPDFPMANEVDYQSSIVLSETEDSVETLTWRDTGLLTYDQYREIEQNEKYLKIERDLIDHGKMGSGTFTSLIGYKKYSECFDCVTREDFRSHKKSDRYYLELPGYTLKDNDSRFLVKNGEYYLEYPVWDSVYKLSNGEPAREGHYEYKKLRFRFVQNTETSGRKQKGAVLIPISAKTYNTFSQVATILLLLIGLALLYICIGLPAKVLIRISQGDIFTRKNVRQLYLSAWCWLLLPFIIILIQHLLKWSFHRYITADVKLTPLTTLENNQTTLIGGLIILAIAKSFKKGLSLQDEQDLTI